MGKSSKVKQHVDRTERLYSEADKAFTVDAPCRAGRRIGMPVHAYAVALLKVIEGLGKMILSSTGMTTGR
jgi:hypothetical protein